MCGAPKQRVPKTHGRSNALAAANDVSSLPQGRAPVLFSPYKIIDSENFIKVSQNPNKVARDAQGLPTVPHNDFGGLNFKGLVSKYLFVMITSPYKITFSQKNRTSGTLTSEKTSDSALSGGCGVDIWSSFLFCVSSF